MRRVAVGLGVLLLASYAYFQPGPQWNELSRFNLVRSLVERQRLDIDPYHANTEDKAVHGGHTYSDKAPGASFLAAPAYAAYRAYLNLRGRPQPEALRESELRARLGRPSLSLTPERRDRMFFNASFRRAVYVCNLATNVVAGAGMGVLLFLMLAARPMAAPGSASTPMVALLAALSLSLGSLVFAYSTVFFGHVLAGAALLGAFAFLGPFFPAPDSSSVVAPRRVVAAGALAGLAVLTELPAALGGLALAVYLAARFRGAGGSARAPLLALLRFAGGALPPLALLAAYQWAAFGGPLATGYAQVASPLFAEGMSRGLLGVSWPRPGVFVQLLVGPSRGLLYLAPVLLLGFVGLVSAVRAEAGRREALLAAAIVLAFLLLSAGYFMWWGGTALGPRHVVPALPFLCFGIPYALGGAAGPRRQWVMPVAGLLLLISAANQLAGVAVSVFAPPGGDLLRGHVWGNVLAGRLAIHSGTTNVGMLLGLRGPASLLPLVLLWVVGVSWLVREVKQLPPSPVAPSASGQA